MEYNNIEVWRPVAGYEGLYEVSNYGRVKSLDRWIDNRHKTKTFKQGRILKTDSGCYGHLRVTLYKDKVIKRLLVHRLVAEAFIPNPDNLPVVNHKDENPSNNRADNLEWCTAQYNAEYLEHMKRWGQKFINRKDLSKPIVQLDKEGVFVKRWDSINEAARSGIASKQNIMRVLKKRKGARFTAGFKWVYESEYF